MAPNRGTNRQREFDDLTQTEANDFDPEDDHVPLDDDDDVSDSSQGSANHDGREHYVETEKSKLRKPKSVTLGPQYRGAKVGRDALEESDDEDDPFMRDFGDEDSEEDSGVERIEDDEEDEMTGSEDEGAEDLTDATDVSEDDEADSNMRLGNSFKERQELGADLKKALQEDEGRSVTKMLSKANREEAEKGRAVKRQRTGFDSLLNTRMKLQKSLIATNTLVGTPTEAVDDEREAAHDALEAAEVAAFKLWNSLNTLREDLLAAQSGSKRKRTAISADSPTEDLWTHVQAQDALSRPNRDAVLKKWSNKAQGPTQRPETGRLNQTQQATIVDVLQEHLSNPTRLLARAHTPRSSAPLQLSQGKDNDPKIYDDVDFYSLLLKELLEQKSQDSVAASSIDLGYQVRREAKTKKNVDTKASKGRKLRYTVHEKLQNFMAPEDRTRWGERQTDELFGSLFGQKLGLAEQEEDEDEEIDGVDAEEAGLLMFRS